MGNNTIKMVMVTTLKMPDVHRVCSRRLKKAGVSPMSCVHPSAMHDIVAQVGKTNSDAVGIDIGTLTYGQAQDAAAIADTNMLRSAMFDSRRPTEADAAEKTDAIWMQFRSTVQSIRNGLARNAGTVPTQTPKTPAPKRDERRLAASMKGGDFAIAPGAAPVRNALHKFPDKVVPAVQKKVPTQDEITASVVALFKAHHRQPPPVGVAQKLGLPLAGVQAAYRKLMGESKIEAEDSDAPDRWVWKSEEPVEAKAEVIIDEVNHRPPNDAAESLTVIEPFDFRGHPVRVYDRDGKTVWVAKDVCETLGISNVSDALEVLETGSEKIRIDDPDPIRRRGNPLIWVLTEAGLYRLVFKSTKPEAEAVKKWLSHDVLPALRRKGYYIMGESQDATPASQVQILEALLVNAKQVEAHNTRIAQLAADSAAIAAKQEEERIAREKAIAEERAARKALADQMERDRKEAEERAEKERAERERLTVQLPQMIKREVDNRPPLQTPVQQPMNYGATIGVTRGEELNEDVRDAGRFAVGRVVSVPPTDLGKKAAEIWLRQSIRGRAHTKARIPPGAFARAPEHKFDAIRKAIDEVKYDVIALYNDNIRKGWKLPKYAFDNAKWEIEHAKPKLVRNSA